MSEEKQTVTMYYYFDDNGQICWTSNEQLALSRAREYDSEVYRVEEPTKK